MRRVVLLTITAVLGAAAPAAAQWSAAQSVSREHQGVAPLGAGGYRFSDAGREGVALGGRELALPRGTIDVRRFGRSGLIALVVRGVPRRAGLKQRSVVGVASGSSDRGFGRVRRLASGWLPTPPVVSVAPSGEAVVAWTQARGRDRVAVVAHRPAGSRFGRPRVVVGRGTVRLAGAAVGAGGDIAVVAVRGRDVVARRRPRGGRWQREQVLARPAVRRTDSSVGVWVDPDGRVLALWRRVADGRRSLEAAAASRRTPFGRNQTLAADGVGNVADIAVVPARGGWAVAYAWAPGALDRPLVRVHIGPGGDRFGAPRPVSAPTLHLYGVDLAVGTGGRLAVGWMAPVDLLGRGFVALSGFSGAGFGPPALVTGERYAASLELESRGDGFVVRWSESLGSAEGREVVRERRHP